MLDFNFEMDQARFRIGKKCDIQDVHPTQVLPIRSAWNGSTQEHSCEKF
jgi:hypothetical protein